MELVLHQHEAWLTFLWHGVVYKNGLVDEIYLKINIQRFFIFLCSSNIWILFPYFRSWLDHVPPNLFQGNFLCRNFFLFPEECVLKVHPPAHVNKTKSFLMNGNNIWGCPDYHDFPLTRVWEQLTYAYSSIQKWPSGAFVTLTFCSWSSQTSLERL